MNVFCVAFSETATSLTDIFFFQTGHSFMKTFTELNFVMKMGKHVFTKKELGEELEIFVVLSVLTFHCVTF
jgi:hypothetical protein